MSFIKYEERVAIYNKRAIKVYKKLGFKVEGIKREHILYKGKFHDSLSMGILHSSLIRAN